MHRMLTARKWMNRAVGIVVTTQISAMIGLTIADMVVRRKRKPRRFPILPAESVRAGDHEVTVYTFGEDLYADMLSAISSAKDHVYLETYIWKSDEVGERFKQALIHASRRGVDVRVVYDGFGNMVVPRSFYDMGEKIKRRRHPMISGFRFFNPRNLGRNHRKLLVVDASVAFIGGYNIGSLYADRWRDTHAKVLGPVVAELENAFVDYWNSRPLKFFGNRMVAGENDLQPTASRVWRSAIQVHRNTPRWQMYPIRNMYLEAIDRAADHILLTQAYLIPDDDFVAALFAAVQRGVDVRIIVPQRSNHAVADWLSRGYYEDLLSHGVRLFRYQGAMVHAKTGTIDGVWSTIGTANLDRLSLAGNYEINIEITGEEVADRMERIYQMDLGNCVELTHQTWQRRSIVAKFTEDLLTPWRPFF